MMIGWAVLIFIVAFNAAVPVGNMIVHDLGAPNPVSYTYNNQYNYTVFQSNIGCSTVQTGTSNPCKSINPNPNLFSFVASFGDWIDSLGYLGAFLGGVFMPYWYLTNVFGLNNLFAALINILVWFSYTTIPLYYLSFRNPEI